MSADTTDYVNNVMRPVELLCNGFVFFVCKYFFSRYQYTSSIKVVYLKKRKQAKSLVL